MPDRDMTAARRRCALALVLAVAPVTGCATTTPGTSQGQTSAGATPVADRPDIDTADRGYRALVARAEAVLRDVGGIAISGTQWDIGGAGCSGTDPALRYSTRSYTRADTYPAVPDAKWAAVVSAFDAFLTPKGYTRKQVLANAPGTHEIRWFDADGSSIDLGTEKRTSLLVWSACHPDKGARSTASAP